MFEEVKEMIDSTIYTNGRGEVTAQNINLAFHGVVDATEEELGKVNDAVKTVEDKVTELEQNGPASSGPLRVWVTSEELALTEEQMTENADTFAKLFSGYPGLVYMVHQEFFSEEGQSGVQTSTNIAITYAAGTENGVNVVVLYGSAGVGCMLLQDGTAELL